MTRHARAIHEGDTVHIQPHDVFRHTPDVHHVHCDDTDVHVEAVIPVETIVVICWRTTSTTTGATVYDRDAPVELVA